MELEAGQEQTPSPRSWHWLSSVVELDLRSLALFRIGLGVILASDLLVALTNAEAFYSDSGTLPLGLLMERAWHHSWAWSLHAWHGSVIWQQMLIGLGLLAAVALAFGWKTRCMTVVSWLLWCSLETRNPEIVNGADPVIRLLLFWGIFLPLGGVWSVDSRIAPRDGTTVRGVPVLCLLLQVSFIYWFSAWLKTDPTWHGEGTAVWQVMHADMFARPAAVWLRLFPGVCEGITHATIWLEIWGPWLLFIPFGRTFFRLLAVVLFSGFHLGIQLTMDIGSFPLAMVVAWSAVIPSTVWEWCSARPRGAGASGISGEACPRHGFVKWLRDGFCLLCLIYVFMWNLRTTDFQRWEPWFSRKLNGIGFALRLDQFWTMFAPFPWLDDGWPILAARLVDGAEVDLLNDGQPLTLEKPKLCSARYKDSRWQKYVGNLWMKSMSVHRDYLARYLVRRWNAEHGALQQVAQWELVYMLERTRKDGKGIEPVRKQVIARSVEGMK